MIIHIVAVSEDGVIGKDGGIPWNLPEDLVHFKECTNNNTVIMGRKTADSIGRRLKSRINIVVSSNSDYTFPDGSKPKTVAKSAAEAVLVAGLYLTEHIFVIGGESVYADTISVANQIILTRVPIKVPGGDTFYSLEKRGDFAKTHHPKKGNLNIERYIRI